MNQDDDQAALNGDMGKKIPDSINSVRECELSLSDPDRK
jgi:hypothetical protein